MSALLDQCDTCHGMGDYIVADGPGYVTVVCETCDGSGEAPVLCPCCDHEVDEHGWCTSCREAVVIVPLTECVGDPLLGRAA